MARNKATCTCCGLEFFTCDMVKTAMPNRGGNGAYMCRNCATHNRWYHTSNNELQGKQKKNAVCVGWELETSFSDDYARNILFEYGMIPTNDSSLSGSRTCEYVSGIQQGLNIGSKMCVTIEKLMNDGHLSINSSCGTHYHVSVDNMQDCNGNKTYMGYIRRFYHSLFVPLAEAMSENHVKTIELFGRYFTGYARMIDRNSDANSRYNFINATNENNIEFRLNKFVSAKQAQTVTKMEVEMVKCIVTNFCEHFNDTEWDRNRYETRTAYRKHKADVTANKLVNIYRKYSENI